MSPNCLTVLIYTVTLATLHKSTVIHANVPLSFHTLTPADSGVRISAFAVPIVRGHSFEKSDWPCVEERLYALPCQPVRGRQVSAGPVS